VNSDTQIPGATTTVFSTAPLAVVQPSVKKTHAVISIRTRGVQNVYSVSRVYGSYCWSGVCWECCRGFPYYIEASA
jgi:hypothetical protein